MPELTIDGTKIEVEPGTTILEAAEELGKDIPVFCYHPGLSPDGNCRMCIVDVEDAPIMQPSCITECQDGMVVHTNNEKTKEGRESILEFLLLNHPLDCPICDKSGECMLQDHYFEYSAEKSRMEDPKVTKRKVVDVGPDIVLDTERCILCTRCIRFVEEVSEEPSLGIVNRGDHAELTTFPGMELDDPYSLNTVDICPVGALTSKKFRFQKRVWFLEETDSICPNCSRGCSMTIDHEGGEIYRFMPRHNPDVNDYWLCDEGRQTFDWVTSEDRLEHPLKSEKDSFQKISWNEASDTLVEEADEWSGSVRAAGLLSVRLSNEENYLFTRYMKHLSEEVKLSYLPGKTGWLRELTEDDILRNADKNPNRKGVELLEEKEPVMSFSSWLQELNDNPPEILILTEPLLFERLENHREEMENILDGAGFVVAIATHRNLDPEQVDLLLPGLTWAEKNGTFTNFDGQVQRFKKALDGPEQARSQIDIMTWLGDELPIDSPFKDEIVTVSSIFEKWAEEIPEMDWTIEDLGDRGKNVSGEENVEVSPKVNILERDTTESEPAGEVTEESTE